MPESHPANPLGPQELKNIIAYWRAANYLSVGQIYLMENPLLREPLRKEQIKPRLLGHWGTTPGLNFIYAHMNRVIKSYDLNAIYVCGPGHGGPGMVANTYLEGTYSEFYPGIPQSEDGMKRLFRLPPNRWSLDALSSIELVILHVIGPRLYQEKSDDASKNSAKEDANSGADINTPNSDRGRVSVNDCYQEGSQKGGDPRPPHDLQWHL